jgi:SPP1 family predicted phage head-tail adaptor
MLNAGDLPHRVALVRDTVTKTHGAEARTPETLGNAWARVDILSGNELWKAQQNNATVNAKVTMRYRTDLKTSDRIEWKGWRLEVVAQIPDEVRQASLVLMCEGKRA